MKYYIATEYNLTVYFRSYLSQQCIRDNKKMMHFVDKALINTIWIHITSTIYNIIHIPSYVVGYIDHCVQQCRRLLLIGVHKYCQHLIYVFLQFIDIWEYWDEVTATLDIFLFIVIYIRYNIIWKTLTPGEWNFVYTGLTATSFLSRAYPPSSI